MGVDDHKVRASTLFQFSSRILEFSTCFWSQFAAKNIKYETFIIDIHHSLLCNMNELVRDTAASVKTSINRLDKNTRSNIKFQEFSR